MKNTVYNNKYKEGEVVYARIDPTLKLVVRRFDNQIYYCRIDGNPEQKELVYFERDLFTKPESVKVAL